jgi:hypothetical protein
MNRVHAFIAIGAGLMVAATAGFAITSRVAEAEGDSGFARPNYELARRGETLDLTRYGSLGDVRRLAHLGADELACQDALAAANVIFTELPAIRASGGCGFDDAVVVKTSLAKWKAPKALPMACNLAAKMHLWERHVVIPAAEKHLGSPVVEIELFGSFQCRRVSGADRLSEHAFAKAVDIAAFTLADGRRVSVLEHYRSKGPRGDFLREIQGRACDLFDVTLGPNYNAEHRNHFHVDVGGEHTCR